eukprot:1184124-Prorocentrum_minimum.AAC.1
MPPPGGREEREGALEDHPQRGGGAVSRHEQKDLFPLANSALPSNFRGRPKSAGDETCPLRPPEISRLRGRGRGNRQRRTRRRRRRCYAYVTPPAGSPPWRVTFVSQEGEVKRKTAEAALCLRHAACWLSVTFVSQEGEVKRKLAEAEKARCKARAQRAEAAAELRAAQKMRVEMAEERSLLMERAADVEGAP